MLLLITMCYQVRHFLFSFLSHIFLMLPSHYLPYSPSYPPLPPSLISLFLPLSPYLWVSRESTVYWLSVVKQPLVLSWPTLRLWCSAYDPRTTPWLQSELGVLSMFHTNLMSFHMRGRKTIFVWITTTCLSQGLWAALKSGTYDWRTSPADARQGTEHWKRVWQLIDRFSCLQPVEILFTLCFYRKIIV